MAYKHICQYENCKKEFESPTNRAKYCCNSHRVSAQRHKNGLGASDVSSPAQPVKSQPTIQKMNIPTPAGLDFGTQMIFDMLKKESQRFEDAYNEQKKKIEKLQDEKALLEKQLVQVQHDNEKQKLIDAKPTGLAGIADHPVIKEIGMQLAPHIAGLVGRVMNPTLPEADQTALWLEKQPEEVQTAIRQLITEISTIQGEPARMVTVIGQLINVIQKGSVISQQQTKRNGTTGDFGLGNF